MCDVCVVVYISLFARVMRVKRLFSEEDEKIEKWIAQTFAKMDFDDVVASLNRALVFLPLGFL